MTCQSQPGKAQFVQVVEADILDRMNEPKGLIAERAHEIYQSRGGGHGSDHADWFRAEKAEKEVLRPRAIERALTDGALRITALVPGFEAKDLEVEIGQRRAVILGVHSSSNPAAGVSRKEKKEGDADC
jgi:HSP20 family molecular chaperone IbpA